MIDDAAPCQIIDIREMHEVDSGMIPNGIHLPMAEVLDHLNELPRSIPVVVYCKSGSRAAAIVHVLRKEKGLTNVLHLEGGIQAWASEINPKTNVY